MQSRLPSDLTLLVLPYLIQKVTIPLTSSGGVGAYMNNAVAGAATVS